MFTYLIKSQDLYKIGKTSHVENRMKSFKTANPYFELIHVIEGDCEAHLHDKFKDARSHLEWFYLSDEDINYIVKYKKEEVCQIREDGLMCFEEDELNIIESDFLHGNDNGVIISISANAEGNIAFRTMYYEGSPMKMTDKSLGSIINEVAKFIKDNTVIIA